MAQHDNAVDPCPWGDEPIDLRNTEISPEGKRWLGRQLVSRRIPLRTLAAKYRLNIHTLTHFRKIVKKNGVLRSGPGRPAILDGEGIETLRIAMSNEQSKDKSTFIQKLNIERINTIARRDGSTPEESELPKIANCTIHRYLARLENNLGSQAEQSAEPSVVSEPELEPEPGQEPSDDTSTSNQGCLVM